MACLCLILLLSCSAQAQARDSISKPLKPLPENGLKIGYDRFFTIPNKPGLYDFYIEKLFPADNAGIRFGLDLTIQPHTGYKFYFSGLYLGYQAQFSFLKNELILYAGADALIHQYVAPDGKFVLTHSIAGPAPLAGLQVKIFRWLYVHSEFSYLTGFYINSWKTPQGFSGKTVRRDFGLAIEPHRLFSLGITFRY